MKVRLVQLFVFAMIAALTATACGPAAAPTAAPAPVATAKPSAPPTAAPSGPVSAPTEAAASPVFDPNGRYSYPIERVKELLAENFYLSGMAYGAGQEAQYGGVAVFAHRLDIPSADPMFTGTISLNGLSSQLTGKGNLVRQKRSNVYEAEAFLARSWTVEDDSKVWTFKLRPEVKWHDGTPLTAEDVKFWIDLASFPPAGRKTASYKSDFGPLKEVQAVDPLTVRLILKESTPLLLETLASGGVVLSHPRHLAQPIIEKGNLRVQMSDMNWVSIGPFKFESYDVGSRFKTVRNPYYFEKDEKGRALPYLDAIDSPIIPDSNTGVSAFRAGRVHGTARGSGYHLLPGQVAGIKKDIKDKAWFIRSPYVAWGPNLNATAPPFSEVKLRKAVQLFVDRQEGIQLVWGGFAIESGLMVPGSYWSNPELRTWPGFNPATKKQDRAEAAKLLQESGLANAKVGITCRDNYVSTCEFMYQQFQQLGLDPRIELVSTVLESERLQSGNYQANAFPGGASLPGTLLVGYLTANPLNSVKHGDTKIDDYNRLVQTTIDPEKRRAIVWEAEKYVIFDKAYYPMWFREESVIAYRTFIKGIWVPGSSTSDNNEMATAWIDPKAR